MGRESALLIGWLLQRGTQGVPKEEALRPKSEAKYQPDGWFLIVALS